MSDTATETSSETSSPQVGTEGTGLPTAIRCPKCAGGIGHPVHDDENGTAYHCFACQFQWSVPKTDENVGLYPGNVSSETDLNDLRQLAAQYGIDPNSYDTKTDLREAIENRLGARANV